jgi:RNA polymerase sigma-70 factor (ECF subfamily)
VFLVIWQKRQQLQVDNVPGYLAAIARFATYRYLAGEEKKQVKERAAALAKPAFSATEKLLEDRLMLEIVEKLTNKLPEKCRLVFIYNKLLDQPIEEVAARLSISVKTAEAHLTKALRIIRQHLGPTALSLLLLLKP